MTRLSRDRWIPPDKAYDLAFRLAGKFGSGSPEVTIRAWLSPMVEFNGMLRGKAVCERDHPARGLLSERLRKIEKKGNTLASGEMEIMNFVLKKGAYKWM